MTLSFCFSGWVRGVEVERVYETETGRELIVDEDGDNEVRLIDEKTKGDAYNITLEEFKDRLQDGRFTLSLSGMLAADCHTSEREIFDIDDVQA